MARACDRHGRAHRRTRVLCPSRYQAKGSTWAPTMGKLDQDAWASRPMRPGALATPLDFDPALETQDAHADNPIDLHEAKIHAARAHPQPS